MHLRSFIITQSSIGSINNRYRCKNPLDVVQKYAAKILSKYSKKICVLTIKETTRGSEKKSYRYKIYKGKTNYQIKCFKKCFDLDGGGYIYNNIYEFILSIFKNHNNLKNEYDFEYVFASKATVEIQTIMSTLQNHIQNKDPNIMHFDSDKQSIYMIHNDIYWKITITRQLNNMFKLVLSKPLNTYIDEITRHIYIMINNDIQSLSFPLSAHITIDIDESRTYFIKHFMLSNVKLNLQSYLRDKTFMDKYSVNKFFYKYVYQIEAGDDKFVLQKIATTRNAFSSKTKTANILICCFDVKHISIKLCSGRFD
jgi:hypothetical protein